MTGYKQAFRPTFPKFPLSVSLLFCTGNAAQHHTLDSDLLELEVGAMDLWKEKNKLGPESMLFVALHACRFCTYNSAQIHFYDVTEDKTACFVPYSQSIKDPSGVYAVLSLLQGQIFHFLVIF